MSDLRVSTTILTNTRVLLPLGKRVNILLGVTVEAGPDTDIAYRQSETHAMFGPRKRPLEVIPLDVHATRATSYGYLLVDVAEDAPLGEASLFIDQLGFSQQELTIPVTVVAEPPMPN